MGGVEQAGLPTRYHSPMTLLDSAAAAIQAWKPGTDAQVANKDYFLQALAHGTDILARHPLPTHLTASTFVLDRQLGQVLLVFHGKGKFWVQPGGHLEPGDRTIEEAALREVEEETGLEASLLAQPTVIDLDHHQLSAAFGHCRSHLDIGVAVLADASRQLRVSDESEDVRWFPVDSLPDNLASGFRERLAAALDRLR